MNRKNAGLIGREGAAERISPDAGASSEGQEAAVGDQFEGDPRTGRGLQAGTSSDSSARRPPGRVREGVGGGHRQKKRVNNSKVRTCPLLPSRRALAVPSARRGNKPGRELYQRRAPGRASEVVFDPYVGPLDLVM